MGREPSGEIHLGECFLVQTQGSEKEHLKIAVTDSRDDPENRGRAVFVSVSKIRPEIEKENDSPARTFGTLVEYKRRMNFYDAGNEITREKTVRYCILDAGDHPFITVKSRVDFSKILWLSKPAITGKVSTEKIVKTRKADPASSALVKKIREAMPKNREDGKRVYLTGITPSQYRQILENERRRLRNFPAGNG